MLEKRIWIMAFHNTCAYVQVTNTVNLCCSRPTYITLVLHAIYLDKAWKRYLLYYHRIDVQLSFRVFLLPTGFNGSIAPRCLMGEQNLPCREALQMYFVLLSFVSLRRNTDGNIISRGKIYFTAVWCTFFINTDIILMIHYLNSRIFARVVMSSLPLYISTSLINE